MGCSNDKFEAEVKKEVFAYINILSISSDKKDALKMIIIEDLRKKSAAFQSYHYDYKEDDKDKVVKEYKEMAKNLDWKMGNIQVSLGWLF